MGQTVRSLARLSSDRRTADPRWRAVAPQPARPRAAAARSRSRDRPAAAGGIIRTTREGRFGPSPTREGSHEPDRPCWPENAVRVRPRGDVVRWGGGGPTGAADAGDLPRTSDRDPRQLHAGHRCVRLRPARRDDPDARRRAAAHRHPGAEGRDARADPPHAHAVRRHGDDHPRAEPAPRPDPRGLRQRHRRDRRRRVHPRRPGHPRQARLRGRLRHEPAAARPAEPDAGRRGHRHLRHHRLAGQERARRATAGSASSASPTTASCR